MPEPTSGAEALRIGGAHLAAAEWAPARRAFEAAVSLDPTAAALEGLSWSAWWLDDAGTVFDARERAYRAYRADGDPVSAARMATWLACDHLDFRGATTAAGGWIRRAHRLLDGLADVPEHGWLAFFEGFLVAAAGDTATAMPLAERAHDLGRRLDVPDLEMLGLALLGSCQVGRGEFSEGLRVLDEAQVMTGEADHPIAAAWTSCFLVSSCTSVLDLDRAFQWCGVIEQFAERYGSRYMLAFCRAEYGVIHLWRGEWADAENMLEAAVADFTGSRPGMVAGAATVLAELRRRQGRPQDAAPLLELAGGSSAGLECRARLELDRGHAGRARDLAERALRRCPPDRVVDRLTLLEVLVRCRIATGDLAAAHAALADLRRADASVGLAPVHALARLAEGACATAAGRYEEARIPLEDAVDGFERSAAAYDAARSRTELATTLLALGRGDQAAHEAAAAVQVLEALGAAPEAKRARQLAEAAAHASDPRPLPVTRRERDVLVLLAEGLTNRQIAERLVVSEHTVHRHVTNILRKLDLPSRTAAAAYAVRTGLTPVER